MYIEDYDERLPPSASWNEDLRPCLAGHNESIYRCPQEPDQKVPSYALNGRLQKLNVEKVASPEKTVLVFDSIPGRDLAGGRELLPSPPRHNGYDNVGFLDGHVKTYRGDNLASLIWQPRISRKKSGSGKHDKTKH